MSQPPKLTLMSTVSSAAVQDFFTVITANRTVYVCLIFTDKSAASMYLETEEDDNRFHGLIRIFHRKADAEHYARQVSILEEDQVLAAKFSAFTLDTLFEKFATLKAGLVSHKIGRPIVAMATVLENDEFMDLGILWSSNAEYMV